jgi:hypothetical protein
VRHGDRLRAAAREERVIHRHHEVERVCRAERPGRGAAEVRGDELAEALLQARRAERPVRLVHRRRERRLGGRHLVLQRRELAVEGRARTELDVLSGRRPGDRRLRVRLEARVLGEREARGVCAVWVRPFLEPDRHGCVGRGHARARRRPVGEDDRRGRRAGGEIPEGAVDAVGARGHDGTRGRLGRRHVERRRGGGRAAGEIVGEDDAHRAVRERARARDVLDGELVELVRLDVDLAFPAPGEAGRRDAVDVLDRDAELPAGRRGHVAVGRGARGRAAGTAEQSQRKHEEEQHEAAHVERHSETSRVARSVQCPHVTAHRSTA